MKSFALALLLHVLLSSAEDCTPDHDDTLLLQTRAVTTEARAPAPARKKKVPNFHRYHINIQEDAVSLLQSKRAAPEPADDLADPELSDNFVVYTAVAYDNAGVAEEVEDAYGSELDTGGEVEVYDEAGDSACTLKGFSAESIPEEGYLSFIEGPDFCSSVNNNSMVNVEGVDTSNASDVFLIEIPDMDSKHVSKAEEMISNKLQDWPDHRVLLHGNGAGSIKCRTAVWSGSQVKVSCVRKGMTFSKASGRRRAAQKTRRPKPTYPKNEKAKQVRSKARQTFFQRRRRSAQHRRRGYRGPRVA